MTRPAWTITEAAERCAVSKSTVRRYREAGRFPHAFKDTSGAWKVPIEDLLAVGWKPVDPTLSASTEQPPDDGAVDRVRQLEQALAVERSRRETAERIAAMAQANVADLRLALRMLEAKPAERPVDTSEQPQSVPSEQPLNEAPEQVPGRAELPHEQPETSPMERGARQSWWSRLTGARR